MAGMSYNLGGRISELELVRALVLGARQADCIAMTGDGKDPEEFVTGMSVIREQEWGIPVIKPWSIHKIKERIRICEAQGVPAIGIDIDSIGLNNPGKPGDDWFLAKTREDLDEIVRTTRLPVILKGIMCEDDADLAMACGAAGIVVSNHGGRALDSALGVAEVLPSISRRISGGMIIFADGGVRSGTDVLKYLALGADAVLVGRPLLVAAAAGGAEAVRKYLHEMTEELRLAMILTGCSSLDEIGSHLILR
jgi:hypothetical protein